MTKGPHRRASGRGWGGKEKSSQALVGVVGVGGLGRNDALTVLEDPLVDVLLVPSVAVQRRVAGARDERLGGERCQRVAADKPAALNVRGDGVAVWAAAHANVLDGGDSPLLAPVNARHVGGAGAGKAAERIIAILLGVGNRVLLVRAELRRGLVRKARDAKGRQRIRITRLAGGGNVGGEDRRPAVLLILVGIGDAKGGLTDAAIFGVNNINRRGASREDGGGEQPEVARHVRGCFDPDLSCCLFFVMSSWAK